MKKILIIDDNVDIADLLAMTLSLDGHVTLARYGGLAGLQAIADFDPDVILLDVGMPGMDGYEVAACIRKDSQIRQPFLIAFTAWSSETCVAKAMLSGFNLHLKKTSSFDALRAAIIASER